MTAPSDPVPSDRDTLRWACREGIPCGLLLPGHRFWGRSFHVDLRESGPRPQLAIAQPTDLVTGRLRPLASGDSVRLWSVRDGRPWHTDGFVGSVGVIEGRSTGPVEAAIVRLPYRLLATEQRLRPAEDGRASRLRIEVAALGPGDAGSTTTLVDRWVRPDGSWQRRGDGYLAELSRRTMAMSVPLSSSLVFLPGAALRVGLELPDLRLRTRVGARVVASMTFGDQVLYGVALGGPSRSISDDEHRETLRRASALVR